MGEVVGLAGQCAGGPMCWWADEPVCCEGEPCDKVRGRSLAQLAAPAFMDRRGGRPMRGPMLSVGPGRRGAEIAELPQKLGFGRQPVGARRR